MKYFFHLYPVAILLLPTTSSATDLDKRIDHACQRHATALVTRLKSEVLDELTQQQSSQTLKLASESCQAYLAKEFSMASNLINAEEQAAIAGKEKTGDTFTDKWLDSADKDGNKRLKKKR